MKDIFFILLWLNLCCTVIVGQQNIEGSVYQDLDANCTFTNGDINLSGITVKALLNGSNNIFYYGTTDADGHYSISCPSGTYTVYPVRTPYTQPNCTPFSGVVTTQASDTIDFPLEVYMSCPAMNVDVSAPILTKAFSSTYTIEYSNRGTATANQVQIELEVDSFLNVQSFSIPPASQLGNVYLFNIGTVGVAQSGTIDMEVQVKSTAIDEQTHCVRAYITPDSSCYSGSAMDWWLDIEGTCRNDSVLFTIRNQSALPAISKPYWVFEDDIIMRTGNVNVVNGIDTIIGLSALPRKFYRIEVGDISNAPDSIFSAFVEGCVPDNNGEFNTGFPTQYNNANRVSWDAVDCQQNTAVTLANRKMAQPQGYRAGHYINVGQFIDYQINFQNTGASTVHKITIIDTLSNYLNPSSVQLTSASHPYTWSIKDQNILEIQLDSVNLPSSSVDISQSYGFVKFRIEQNFPSPIGNVIENLADVYMDQQPPIQTNLTIHETASDFFITPIITICPEVVPQMKVYPNPFKDRVTIEMGGEPQEVTLVVYDIIGREMVRIQESNTTRMVWTPNNLKSGVYVFNLFAEGKVIGKGRIIAQ